MYVVILLLSCASIPPTVLLSQQEAAGFREHHESRIIIQVKWPYLSTVDILKFNKQQRMQQLEGEGNAGRRAKFFVSSNFRNSHQVSLTCRWYCFFFIRLIRPYTFINVCSFKYFLLKQQAEWRCIHDHLWTLQFVPICGLNLVCFSDLQ